MYLDREEEIPEGEKAEGGGKRNRGRTKTTETENTNKKSPSTAGWLVDLA